MKSSEKIFLLLSIIFTISNAHAVSFDCNKASRVFEKAICSNIELSKLDDELNVAYKNAFSINPEIKISQRDWIKSSRLCENNLSDLDKCIKNAYIDRLVILKNQKSVAAEQPDLSDARVNSSLQDKNNSKNKLLEKNEFTIQETRSGKQNDQYNDIRETKVVIVEGVGTDIPSATQNAAQNALTEIVGSFMDANKMLEKKTEIRDGVRSQTTNIRSDIKEYSQGTIKSFELINIVKQSGLIRATASVAVRMDDLRIYVKKLAEGEVAVSSGLFAQMATEKKQLDSQSKLLIENIFLPIFNGQAINLKVGPPRPLTQVGYFDRAVSHSFKEKHGLANIVTFMVEVSLKNEFLQSIQKTLSATTTDSTRTTAGPHDILAISNACDQLNAKFPNDLCFFIINDSSNGYMADVYKGQNARIDIVKKFSWLETVGFSFRSHGPTIPRMELSLIGENGRNLQTYLFDQDTKNEDVELISDGNSSTPHSAPQSLLYTDGSGHYLGFMKNRKFQVAMLISEKNLKDTQKINIRFIK